MSLVPGLSPQSLRKLPADAGDMLLARTEWSYGSMEHSRIGPVELVETGSPFHHLALPLGPAPPRTTLRLDGRCQHGRSAPDTVTMIEAGATCLSHWDGVMESACFYFTDDALAHALGIKPTALRHDVRTRLDYHSPALVRLLRALFLDAASGRPYGSMIGDAIFVALAAQVAPTNALRPRGPVRQGEPWRVRNALAFIHAHLTGDLSIARIADAAATSPFYLNHAFRLSIGCSIWRYVLGARARYANLLMRGEQSLVDVAQAAGFKTYPAFIAAVRHEVGHTPEHARRLARSHNGRAWTQ